MKKLILFTLFIIGTRVLFANNLTITNSSLQVNPNSGFVYVQFDIGWENSWRTSIGVANWDAAWVFIKYRVGSGDWQHAKLSPNSGDHITPTGATIYSTADSMGVFIYRDADGTGNVNFTTAKLAWNYSVDGVAGGASIDFKVLGIEMVYVPQGSFWLGDGVSTNAFRQLSSISSVQINTAATVVKENGNIYGGDAILDAGITIDGDGGICTTGQSTINNPNYPTGYKSFYCMKYEMSQGQYAAFLNLLTATQASARYPNSNGSYRHTISGTYPNYTAAAPDRACNYLSWADGAAYSDWSGLRPMTELEFEKACRGTNTAVAGEYAWGNTNITNTCYTLINNGLPNESVNAAINKGNASYSNTNYNCSIQGPFRCGIFAASATNKTRQESGATFYGIMEMTGDLYEHLVCIGNTSGRNFTGLHGNGKLTAGGDADVSAWPASDANGSGFRGGDWTCGDVYITVSNRVWASLASSSRDNYIGFRGVRNASSALLPSLSTTAVTGITSSSATSGGNITFDGGDAVSARGVCWSTATNPTIADSKTTDGTASGTFISTITGLNGSTTYYVRAYATNIVGAVYGNEVSFTTNPAVLPALTTASTAAITINTATSGGNVTDNGGATVTARGVCWSTLSNPTIANSKTTNGSGIGVFASSITGLLPGTTYYVRAYSTNSVGTAYGNEISFISTALAVGVNYQGGIIAYILQPGDLGYIAGETRGLIAAPSDQSIGIQWYNGSYTRTGATSTALGTGNANTNTIVSNQGAGSYAAKLCYDLVLDGYDDWYLPSIDELNKLYMNKAAIGGFASYYYWSSSEDNDFTRAWYKYFSDGSQGDGGTKFNTFAVRAVRAFPALPTLTTSAASSITTTTATSGGDVTSDGGVAVTARGVCWSISANPTIADSKTTDGNGIGAFTSSITGLSPDSIYYMRAYATNSIGTVYGNEVSFTTLTTTQVADIEGNIYNFVTIGIQTWMKENLKTTKYNDGTSIPLVENGWSTTSSHAYCWYNNDAATYKETFGALYNWYIVDLSNSKKVCPTDWHVPTDAEWTILTTYLGGESVAGGKMKEIGTTHWTTPNTGATNESGFIGFPSGYRSEYDGFYRFGTYGDFWSSTQAYTSDAWGRFLKYSDSSCPKCGYYMKAGLAVRCLKDAPTPSGAILTTNAISNLAKTSATSGGNITNDGGAVVTARGVCWSTGQNPTIANSKTTDGSGNGTFTSSIAGLIANTTYYARAYATNSVTTSYGNEVSFITTLAIGNSFQGGIVAYILQPGDPGYIAGQTHGLIAAPSDQSTGIQWYNGSYTTTGATATALGTGNANTNTIVSIQGAGSYAAKLCYDLVLGGYSDWYLPSKDELIKFFYSKEAIGGFAGDWYWCSSEYDTNNAMVQYFGSGFPTTGAKASTFYVRAVRAF